MKKKTISKVINNKFNEWLDSIGDNTVKDLVKKNSIITGGCIASMLLKEQINDFDVYFTDNATVKAVAEYYVKQFNEANGEDGYVLDGAIVNERNEKQQGGAVLNMTPERIKIIFDSNGVGAEQGSVPWSTGHSFLCSGLDFVGVSVEKFGHVENVQQF